MKKHIRLVLYRLIVFVLRRRCLPMPRMSGGRCVVVAPHYDDETLGCAGVILSRLADGTKVDIVYITDGSASHPHHPTKNPSAISSLRKQESIRAMDRLGIEPASLHFLGAIDGTLASLTGASAGNLLDHLEHILSALQPGEVFVTCKYDGSSEHEAACGLIREAICMAGLSPRIFEYPVWARWRPNLLFLLMLREYSGWRLSFPETVATKRFALCAYVSQIQPTSPWPRPVLPDGFISFFESSEEYFFERKR